MTQIDFGTGMASNGSFFTASAGDVERELPTTGACCAALDSANGTLSATFNPGENLIGHIDYVGTTGEGGGDVLSFPLSYVAFVNNNPVTLPALANQTYTGAFTSYDTAPAYTSGNAPGTITISSAGVLSGTVTCATTGFHTEAKPAAVAASAAGVTCSISGTVTPRSDLTAYDVSFTFANATDGSNDGLAQGWAGSTISGLLAYDPTDGKIWLAGVNPNNEAFAFAN